MDMPYDGKREAGQFGREAPRATDSIVPTPPRWILGVSILAMACALAAQVLVVLHVARPAAVALAGLALCGALAFVAARLAFAGFAGRLELLTRALEQSVGARLIVGPDGRTDYANASFRRFFGTSDPPKAVIARIAAEAEATGRIAVPRQGGGETWLSVASEPVAGRPGYLLWSFEDVTARQAASAEEANLADFLDHAPVGCYSVDETGRFLYVNRTFANWLGLVPVELVAQGVRLSDCLVAPPPDTSPHAPFAAESGGDVVLAGGLRRPFNARITQTVARTASGLRTHSVVRDLSHEGDTEEALRRSRQRLERFFADAPVGIAFVDANGRLEEANPALCELFGLTPADLIGKELAGLLEAKDAAAVAASVQSVGDSKTGAAPVEIRLRGMRERSASVYANRLGADKAGPAGAILHFIDTTERRALEAQFTQSQKMQAVGQLAGGVAHDFNNLLTAMIGFCDLLLLRFRPTDQSYADIMQIKQNANRAANLVRQLLAFSRQQSLQPRILNITDVLDELKHLLRRLIGENIELKVVHARDIGLVKVDQGQLEQVIINLAVNARDAMQDGGTLTIRTANIRHERPFRSGREIMPEGDYVEIEVRDTGIGIPKEILERIFEPFFSTKEVGSGTGLGLSTVYGIVKQTGGFVFVESAPNSGATFSILLPRLEADEAEASVRSDSADSAATRDLTGTGTVLLVEDEDPVRLFSARALKNKGYRVIEAKSGEAALEIITAGVEKVDLLVTDVVMPRMDGPSLIKEVRVLHPDMKVIFISGYAEDSFRKRLGDEGGMHFLPKPFSLKQLAGKVKEVMVAGG
jgi:two-component system, cell cycle sensor histidine kinase and response regulator CckA